MCIMVYILRHSVSSKAFMMLHSHIGVWRKKQKRELEISKPAYFLYPHSWSILMSKGSDGLIICYAELKKSCPGSRLRSIRQAPSKYTETFILSYNAFTWLGNDIGMIFCFCWTNHAHRNAFLLMVCTGIDQHMTSPLQNNTRLSYSNKINHRMMCKKKKKKQQYCCPAAPLASLVFHLYEHR